jgi:uncharacterized protein (DUF849 family)
VRVGLEDNLMLGRGNLASNEMLVENAVGIIERMGASVMDAESVRKKLNLTKHAPA